MSIFEYNQEAHMKCVRQEGFEEGKAEGKAEAILELLEELGDIPKELCERISAEKDSQQLKRWLKLAARVETIEQFVVKM
ncbi:MAG: hypothetical protein IJ379_08510 [Lachnospiraceae bacterium]|nr:hypothetical protein [Lachnospiraceae bacterium]